MALFYIAAVMYVSIVCTALILHNSLALLEVTQTSAQAVKDVAQFILDYTFWMNLVAIDLVSWLSWLNHIWNRHDEKMSMDMENGGKIKKGIALAVLVAVAIGIALYLFVN